MKKAHLTVEHLAKHFKQGSETIEIFSDVSANFEQGKTYAITGASGTGKSTFMHLVAGIEKPDAGVIFFNNNDINKLTNDERAVLLNQSIGVVFQQPYLIRELSVIENVYLPGLIANVPDYGCRDRAMQLLERVGLAGKEASAPSSLSGGQQQRVAIARALFNEPAFLLADEPTGSLDIKTGRAIVDLMVSCQREQGMGILVSTHDAYVAERMDVVLEFVNGNIVQRRP